MIFITWSMYGTLTLPRETRLDNSDPACGELTVTRVSTQS